MFLHAVIVVIAAIVVTQATVLATTVYLHRALAHRALDVHPLLDWVFRVTLWLSTGMRRQEWVVVHRKHHTFTDREGDPHSPMLFGFWKVQLFNVYYYAREAMAPDIVRKFAPDLVEDRWDRYVFSWGWSGLFLGTSILCLILGFWAGIIAMVAHGILYVFVLSPLINGLGHWRGAQNFMNTAYNSRLLAWFTGGGGLDNNHHGYPRSPKFSFKASEFDPAWPIIKLLIALKLAKPYKTIEEIPA